MNIIFSRIHLFSLDAPVGYRYLRQKKKPIKLDRLSLLFAPLITLDLVRSHFYFNHCVQYRMLQ